MHQLRARGWRRLAAVGLGGLLLTGGWYAYAHTAVPDLTRGVLAQEVAATPAPARETASRESLTTVAQTGALTATPAASPVPGQPARSTAKPAGNPNSRRPFGEVTAISQAPASFTIRMADGASQTYRVLETTVFAAGRDRPYRFELLKVGDSVTVVTGGQGQGKRPGQAPGATQPAGQSPEQGQPASPKPRAAQRQGQAQGAGPRAAIRAAQANGETVARAVIVHPAGDAARPRAGKKAAGQNGNGQRNRVAPAASPTPAAGAHAQPSTGQPTISQTRGGSHGTGQ